MEAVNALRLEELRVGGKDQRGRDIIRFLWHTQDYVIYQHSEGISPHFSDDDELAKKQRTAYAAIGTLLSHTYALRSGTHYRTESIDRSIARSIHQCLEGEIDHAKQSLNEVNIRLQRIINIQGQLVYQISSLFVVVVVAMAFFVIRYLLAQREDESLTVLQLSAVALCGALGGFLSISTGIRRLTIDGDAGWYVNALSGASRVVIAMIGSIFVYLTIVSDLAFASLDLLKSQSGIYAVSIAAGFSESLVPNILRRLSVSENSEQQKAARPKDDI